MAAPSAVGTTRFFPALSSGCHEAVAVPESWAGSPSASPQSDFAIRVAVIQPLTAAPHTPVAVPPAGEYLLKIIC